MNILVTGGAGYIGSVLNEELLRDGHAVIAVDNLQQGHRGAIVPEAEFVMADLSDSEALRHLFRNYRIDAVMHLAADSIVSQSKTSPARFFKNNVTNSINLLDIMLEQGVSKLVFSSSAAVYGEPGETPITEREPEKPINPYGETKLLFEKVLHWYGEAYGLRFISLRYFNVAGASQRCGEHHTPETHLIPNILKAALEGKTAVPVFGNDYPTPDGSCIRDYIHVLDIARAHILALKQLEERSANKAYNLGNNQGFSVLEVIETARKITGVSIPTVINPRRPGDPAVLVADSGLARAELGWRAKFSNLESIIESAWRWQKEHPYGYA